MATKTVDVFGRERTANEIRRARRQAGQTGREFAADGAMEAQKLVAKTLTQGARATAVEEAEVEKEFVAEADTAVGKMLRAGQAGGQLVGVMLTITIAAAVGMVGTKITSEVDQSIDTEPGTKYDNASNSISGGFADAMELTDIVFLVLFFTVIIGALLAFRSR